MNDDKPPEIVSATYDADDRSFVVTFLAGPLGTRHDALHVYWRAAWRRAQEARAAGEIPAGPSVIKACVIGSCPPLALSPDGRIIPG